VIDNDSPFPHLIGRMNGPSLANVGILVKHANDVASFCLDQGIYQRNGETLYDLIANACYVGSAKGSLDDSHI
jgi:hypothetical protein